MLNAMYQREDDPGRTTREDREPLLAPPADCTGGGLGRAEHSGPGRRRLRRAELAERFGDPVVPEGMLPGLRCFPSAAENGSRPADIRRPTEGSLDRDTWNRLIAVLTAHSPAGPDTPCPAYHSPMALGLADFRTEQVVTTRLDDATALLDHPESDFTPPTCGRRTAVGRRGRTATGGRTGSSAPPP
ncbi:hypothetical protein [Kitasatospora sp. CB02891]|uniref:hypothetical protein n=1 Tax=Kitasatospora sp. CB02891 TaxID=2020329 RepID=UPI001E2B0816|nr:hypothetical protein [Kitasatospora sp. CB02891]